jgi:hypothetical protein
VLLLQEQQMVAALYKRQALECQLPYIDLRLDFELGKAERLPFYRRKRLLPSPKLQPLELLELTEAK